MAKGKKFSVWLEIAGKDKFSAVFAKATAGLKTFGFSAGRMLGSPLKALDRITGAFGELMKAVPGIAILGRTAMNAFGSLRDLALSTASYADTLDNLRSATGLGSRQIQEMAFAAEHAGVPFEMFQQSLRKMSEVLGRGVGGKELFASLGKDAWGFAKALKAAKSPGDQFELILSQMAAISNPTKRAAFAMRFFSEGGLRLSAAAHNGAEGIKAMRREAERLGIVMSDEEIAKADEFGDTWANLLKVFDSTKRDFGMGLIEGLLPDVKNLLVYVKENRKQIGEMVKDFGRDVGGGIIDAAKWLKGAFIDAKAAVEWLAGNEGIVMLGAALAAVAASPFFAALAAIVAGLKWLLDNTPEPATQNEKDRNVLAGHKRAGTLGGAMGVMEGEMQGNVGPMGWAAGLMGVGAFVANEDERLAEMRDRSQASNLASSQTVNDAMMRLAREIEAPGSSFGMVASGSHEQISLEININDPGGVVDGAPSVKAPSSVQTKTRTTNTGVRTTSHFPRGP